MKKLFFALITSFLFVASSWGQCPPEPILSNETTIGTGDSKSYSTNMIGCRKISFDVKRNATFSGNFVVTIYNGETVIKESTLEPWDMSTGYKNFSIESDDRDITSVKFYFSDWGTGKRTFKNVEGHISKTLTIPTAPINFVNGGNEQTINIDYSALTSDLTAELETKDGIITLGSPYGTSTSSVAIAYAGCTNGTVGLTVTYNPTNCNDYTNKIIFKQNGTTVATINVSSTYNRYVRMNTNDINFTDIKPGEKSEKVIDIAYAYQSENVIATLEKTDSPFSLSTATVAKGDCSVGNIPLTLTYNPTDCEDHTNKIIFTQGGKTIATINVGSTYNRYVNMKTDDISFLPTMELGTQRTSSVDVSYAFISENLTATLENADSPFSLSTPTAASASSVIVAENNCTVGNTTLTITFDPKTTGIYSNVIKLSNGNTINISGECSTNFDTKATNFRVEKVSYTSIKLRWNAVPGATGYRIVNTTNGVTHTVDANTTSLNATGLKMETNYSFVFYALFNDHITSLNASIVSATTLKKEGVVIEDCSKFYENYDEKEQTIGVVGYNNPMIYDNISITGNLPSYKVRFRAKMTTASVVGNPDLCMYVKLAGKDNYENVIYWDGRAAGLDNTYREYFVEIPKNTVSIKFHCEANSATLTRYVDDLYIFRENILEADKTELNFGEVKPNEYKDLSVNLTYSNVAKLEAMLDTEYFTIQSFNETAACTDGTQEVVIRFQPTACFSEYEESLTIFNGQELAITLKGKLITNPGTVSEITWTGAVDTNWDNRANWKKADGNVLSAADVLDAELKVIIPAGLAQYPVIPNVSTTKAFKDDRDKACDCAQVNAGDNASATTTMIAKTIVMEDGAALVGVETLYNPTTDVRRYKEVINHIDARRKEWLLVGTVVKPWTDNGDDVRNILSQDYYLNGLPQVYMHEAVIDDNNQVTWQKTFADLDKEVPHDKAFAIFIANQYGPKMWTAKRYDYQYGTKYAETLDKPLQYTFKGHFFNESDVIHYENLEEGKAVMLCNTYPAPIDAKKLDDAVDGTIYYYDYTGKSFVDATTDAQNNPIILPQNGFVFHPNTGVTSITVDASYMATSTNNIQNRSIAAEPTMCRIKAANTAKSVYSQISIGYDEYKEDIADLSMDAPKLFAAETSALPDIYVMRYDAKWASVTLPDMTQPIPLGVSINADNQTFTIEMTGNNMPYEILLEDRTTATMYNLSAGEVCTVSGLAKGDYTGRFYLYGIPTAEEDEDIETNINTNLDNNGYIDIYTQSNTVIVSAPKDTQLQTITVSDMVGRSTTYMVNGQYAEISMPESNGIYIINVVGEAGIATKKIKM